MSSMLKPPKTSPSLQKGRGEAAEEAVSTAYVRTRNFVDENRTALIAAGVGIVVIFLGILGYFYYQHGQGQRANEMLGSILPVYEAGDFERALEGTDEVVGLRTIASDYRRTPAGNLASFFAGHALFQLERYEEADEFFARFRGEDMVQASALAGRAAVAEERGEHGRAARLYEDAASTYRSAAAAPEYLADAARNHELAGNLDAARRAYEKIAAEYGESQLAGTVPVHLARLDALEARQ
jgi:tetratricopeptide (TPR) repeat protein